MKDGTVAHSLAQWRHFLGRVFNRWAMAFNTRWVEPKKSEPVGRAWRSCPFVVSFVLRCPELCGSVKNTGVPTAEPMWTPFSQSLSQWPDTARVATSAGRSVIGVMLRIWPRQPQPRARGRRACASDATLSAGRSARCRGAVHPTPHRSSRPTAGCACRQATCTRGGWQFVLASSPASERDDGRPQPRIQEFARTAWLTSPSRCQTRRRVDPGGMTPRVACVFVAHGAWRAAQHPDHRSHRQALVSPRLDVSRPSTLMCAEPFVRMATPSVLHVELELQELIRPSSLTKKRERGVDMMAMEWEWPIRDSYENHSERAALLRPILYEMTSLEAGNSNLVKGGKALSLNISSGGMLVLMDQAPDIKQV